MRYLTAVVLALGLTVAVPPPLTAQSAAAGSLVVLSKGNLTLSVVDPVTLQVRGTAPSGPDPYAILGVERDADDRAIKRAYRKLISEHHPDRLGDLPEDLRLRAEKRAGEINAAYERIKAERGFK